MKPESQSRVAERRRQIELVARLAAMERDPEKYRAMLEVINRALLDGYRVKDDDQAEIDAA